MTSLALLVTALSTIIEYVPMKLFVAALIVSNLPNVPPKGWVQMLSPTFTTKQVCMDHLLQNEYVLYSSLRKTFKTAIKGVEKFGCFTEDIIIKMNKDLGHDTSETKDVDIQAYNAPKYTK